jgi:hypothetical protein
MFGVMLTGQRTTSPTGPDVDEIWSDPVNGMIVARRITSATNDSMMALPNYSNAEPDPALFRVPAGYAVVDESGPFTIVRAPTISCAPQNRKANSVAREQTRRAGHSGEAKPCRSEVELCEIEARRASKPTYSWGVGGAVERESAERGAGASGRMPGI